MPVKVLSVDDSKMIHTVIGKAFKNYDVDLHLAANGMEGLAVATRENPDLIILDVTMPVMDGVEMLTKLKADPLLKDIPVIMLTAEAGKENVVKIARIGIRDYIIKPFTEQLVIERVSRILDLQPKGGNDQRVRSLDDVANILVVEDKPAIIEQIRNAASTTPWKINGVGQCGEAIDYTSKEIPDVILISLSLPDRSAFNFFQMMRANTRTKSVPIFGLSVKTATDEQGQAQSIGFNGIITKPLDTDDMMFRLCKAMNLDTSKRYFTIENNIQFVKIPGGTNQLITNEFQSYVKPKISEMVDSGLTKLIVDATSVPKIDMTVIKHILMVIQSARELGIKFRIVGSPEFAQQARTFEDTKDFEIYDSREKALENY